MEKDREGGRECYGNVERQRRRERAKERERKRAGERGGESERGRERLSDEGWRKGEEPVTHSLNTLCLSSVFSHLRDCPQYVCPCSQRSYIEKKKGTELGNEEGEEKERDTGNGRERESEKVMKYTGEIEISRERKRERDRDK